MKLLILCILVAFATAAPKAAKVDDIVEVKSADVAVPEVIDDEAEEIAAEEAAELQAGTCVNNCNGLADGDYASCSSCNRYVSCGGGVFYPDRPCPASLEWDDVLKRCEWTSSTCGDIRRVARGCERNSAEPNSEPLRISCDAGRVIFVRYTFYGRRKPEKRFCPYSRPHNDDTSCLGNPQNDRLIVRGLCDGKNSCEVVPTNQLFGDPCPGTYKYLQVRYSCVKA